MEMLNFQVISLDVWGHGPDEHEKYECDGTCDGYTVNDTHHVGEINVNAKREVFNKGKPGEFTQLVASDKAIIQALVNAGYLNENCDISTVEIDHSDEYDFYVDRKSDGKPLLQLQQGLGSHEDY